MRITLDAQYGIYPAPQCSGHSGTTLKPGPPPRGSSLAADRQKAYRIKTFRVVHRASLIARILQSRLQKLGNVEKAIWGKAF